MASTSFMAIIGVVLFYLLLVIGLGFLGQDLLANVEMDEEISNISINSSSDIGLSELPSFLDGLIFTIQNLPAWLALIMGIVPVLLLIMGILWFIRGGN